METKMQEAGEWIDTEPRADGKPRRWKPGEALPPIDPRNLIKQTQEDAPQHRSESIRPRAHMSK